MQYISKFFRSLGRFFNPQTPKLDYKKLIAKRSETRRLYEILSEEAFRVSEEIMYAGNRKMPYTNVEWERKFRLRRKLRKLSAEVHQDWQSLGHQLSSL